MYYVLATRARIGGYMFTNPFTQLRQPVLGQTQQEQFNEAMVALIESRARGLHFYAATHESTYMFARALIRRLWTEEEDASLLSFVKSEDVAFLQEYLALHNRFVRLTATRRLARVVGELISEHRLKLSVDYNRERKSHDDSGVRFLYVIEVPTD